MREVWRPLGPPPGLIWDSRRPSLEPGENREVVLALACLGLPAPAVAGRATRLALLPGFDSAPEE
jgi:hypothetical protein